MENDPTQDWINNIERTLQSAEEIIQTRSDISDAETLMEMSSDLTTLYNYREGLYESAKVCNCGNCWREYSQIDQRFWDANQDMIDEIERQKLDNPNDL